MGQGKYILVDGSFMIANEYRVAFEDLRLPGFSEQVRSIKTAFPFFKETFESIRLKLAFYNLEKHELIDNNGDNLKRQLERTLTKNKHFLGAILTLSFKFSGNKTSYSIHSESIENTNFSLNEKGLFTEIFDKIQKPVSSLSNLSLGSAPYWEIAERYRSTSLIDEVVITNTSNFILEIPYSNIYFIKGNFVVGCLKSSGAYQDITRPLIIKILKELNLNYLEENVTIEYLETAEEIFVVNAIQGIRWIIGVGGMRFYNNSTRKISELFSKQTIN